MCSHHITEVSTAGDPPAELHSRVLKLCKENDLDLKGWPARKLQPLSLYSLCQFAAKLWKDSLYLSTATQLLTAATIQQLQHMFTFLQTTYIVKLHISLFSIQQAGKLPLSLHPATLTMNLWPSPSACFSTAGDKQTVHQLCTTLSDFSVFIVLDIWEHRGKATWGCDQWLGFISR